MNIHILYQWHNVISADASASTNPLIWFYTKEH